MATNNNGNLLDTAGEVAIDFVWGNLPKQPNDARAEGSRLDPALNDHIIALSGWNGYPQYNPNTTGEDVAGPTDYVLTPNVLGLTTALAQDALKDAAFATITVQTAATNTATQPTRINVTATDTATVYVSGGTSTWPVGTKVTIASGTGIPAAVVGTWSVTGGNGTTLVIAGSGWTVADSGAITPGTRLTGATGTIKTQSIAAGQDNIVPGSTIVITPWA